MFGKCQKHVRYALRLLVRLSLENRPMSSSELAEKELITRNFTLKVLHYLKRSGLVNSIKGKNGGFVLAKSPDEISFLDVISVFEKDLVIVDCNSRCKNYRACRVKYFWNWLSDYLKDLFSNITIKDIASGTFTFHLEKLS
ncbi:MAG TPA: Rrf2 family transcriptional regulator [Thermotoga sp.]|jgi:Rrf2 family protein|uniref:Transcriptional regulator, BadM/Rrf2 family n=2 Tax=Thermotoga petrophila TaxID=93929 RepID=A5IM56_THEP1|nr:MULTISPECIES: RrF2 family transcriptional regulator [Thermotoga]ABQ47279.1 transcriptional regulator, BadM/Rrf2 family [Thermotoga petrophila RKU-1]ACB09534.1 transcriptional regulator, BadM/Rrf2 family [Thermotoga sp. RQ2]ADA67367.1 transcriptional regulator, BadM/Rrf2 family [Thermotoga petrophila RKU-10]HBF69442.1 Rrf2 family transcriptional regulator [Thermotoga sp.]